MQITDEDLRAATAAGIIDEAQAARLGALTHQRAGRRALGLSEDEPFELFSGFAEIFISIGLILLISSAVAFGTILGGLFAITLGLAALCWITGTYFTLKRRMSLPSIILVIGYSMGVGGFLAWMAPQIGLPNDQGWVISVISLLGMAAILVHYRTFRVPFSMLIAGLYGLGFVISLTGNITTADMFSDGINAAFDLRQGGSFAFASLIFGILAFGGGQLFYMREPHRIGRMARSAFWLHLLAAPALVNTLMMTVYNIPGAAGTVLTLSGLLGITIFALIIDRRSFLTAGLGYLAAILFYAIEAGNVESTLPLLMLILGSIVTGLGTFWTALRIKLMHLLPDFPGKDRLPPYNKAHIDTQ